MLCDSYVEYIILIVHDTANLFDILWDITLPSRGKLPYYMAPWGVL